MVRCELGSISTGTLRPEELLPCFLDFLDTLVEKGTFSAGADHPAEVAEVGKLQDALGDMERRMETEGYWDNTDAVSEDLDFVTSRIEERVPSFCYFGAHDGDGADFGVWVDWDTITDAEGEGSLLRLPAGDDYPTDPEVDSVVFVTDHGNADLYQRTATGSWELIWSVV
jgi:hypothetical protein